MNIGPLIWLLVFDGIVALIWWVATSVIGVAPPERLAKLIIGLVILINAAVILFWILSLFGIAGFLEGPVYRR